MPRTSSLLIVSVALLAACGSDDGGSTDGAPDGPRVVVTTSILGDVVSNLVGDLATVEVVMPPGASPHEFQASAQQAAAMREAGVLVVNGGGFEEGLLDTIEAAESDGVATFEALSAIEPLEFGAAGHAHDDEHADDEHADEEHADEEHAEGEHVHEGDDPHFFTDPARMVTVAEALVEFLAEHLDIPADTLRAQAEDYLGQLRALDAGASPFGAVVMGVVTNHEVFGYFADRYDFEVVGVVIAGGGTQAEPSAAELAALADLLVEEGVAVVFADTSSPTKLAESLAAEAGDVDVVELFSESLGEAGSDGATYVDMVTTNAERIAAALG